VFWCLRVGATFICSINEIIASSLHLLFFAYIMIMAVSMQIITYHPDEQVFELCFDQVFLNLNLNLLLDQM